VSLSCTYGASPGINPDNGRVGCRGLSTSTTPLTSPHSTRHHSGWSTDATRPPSAPTSPVRLVWRLSPRRWKIVRPSSTMSGTDSNKHKQYRRNTTTSITARCPTRRATRLFFGSVSAQPHPCRMRPRENSSLVTSDHTASRKSSTT
jgi:hypothetical protein